MRLSFTRVLVPIQVQRLDWSIITWELSVKVTANMLQYAAHILEGITCLFLTTKGEEKQCNTVIFSRSNVKVLEYIYQCDVCCVCRKIKLADSENWKWFENMQGSFSGQYEHYIISLKTNLLYVVIYRRYSIIPLTLNLYIYLQLLIW